jgi:hypothetical protein
MSSGRTSRRCGDRAANQSSGFCTPPFCWIAPTCVSGAGRRGQSGSARRARAPRVDGGEDARRAAMTKPGWRNGDRRRARVKPSRAARREKAKERSRTTVRGAAVDCEAEPDRLRPGEECESPPGHELPGAILPWALTRILHAWSKTGNTGRRPRSAAAREVSPEHASVC